MLLLPLTWQLLFLTAVTSKPVTRSFPGFTPTSTYLVKFRDDAATLVVEQHLNWLLNVSSTDLSSDYGLRHRFSLGFEGYSAVLDDDMVETVFRAPEVNSIEPIGASPPTEPTRFDNGDAYKSEAAHREIKINAAEPSTEDTTSTQDVSYSESEQADAVPTPTRHNAALENVVVDKSKGWNTIRLSHREFDGGYRPGAWLHNGFLGQGAVVYVLDTGVNLLQQGFEGSVVVQPKVFVKNSGPEDIHGHGTMCAGVIAGHYSGLAPGAKLVSLKVANDENISWADDVAAGIQWVVKDRSVENNMKVISLSQVNFSGTPLVNTAVEAAVAAGVHVVVSAGNDNVNACGVSPANTDSAITVGSINAWDALPIKGQRPIKFHRQPPRPPVGSVMPNPGGKKFNNPNIGEIEMEATEAQEAIDFAGFDTVDPEGTNWGPCVTLFAPGIYVPTLSAHNTSTAYHYWGWGTSIAAPQVAALIATRLSEVGPVLPSKMKKWLVEQSTKGQMQGDLKASPNRIAFTGIKEAKSTGNDAENAAQPVILQPSAAPAPAPVQPAIQQQPPIYQQPAAIQQAPAPQQSVHQQAPAYRQPPYSQPQYQQSQSQGPFFQQATYPQPAYQQAAPATAPQPRPAYPAPPPSHSSRTRPRPQNRQDDDKNDDDKRKRTSSSSSSLPWWMSWLSTP